MNNGPRSKELIKLFETPIFLIFFPGSVKRSTFRVSYARGLDTRRLGNIGKGDDIEFQLIDNKQFHHYAGDL